MKNFASRYGNDMSLRNFVGAAGALAMTTALPASAVCMPGERALQLAYEKRDELTALLSEMIGIRSLSGESGADAQETVKDWLGTLPYRIEESARRLCCVTWIIKNVIYVRVGYGRISNESRLC